MTFNNRELWYSKIRQDISQEGGVLGAARAIEERGGPFATWDKLASPEGPCQRYFSSGIYVSLLDPSNEVARKYLKWAVESSSRALHDDRFSVASENRSRGWMNRPGFPGNLGEVRAVNVLASAMLNMGPIDAAALVQSSLEISQSALAYKGKSWNDQLVQGRYLYAVRLSMLAGAWDKAQELIAVKRQFDALSRHFELLKVILEILPCPSMVVNKASVLVDYSKMINHPEAGHVIDADTAWPEYCLRLELALIGQRVSSSGENFPDWPKVLEQVVG
ncbi:hypothetical protein ACQ86G_15785 [Roseateles chitinivorans]|uniref:hypothetical protein n=1 Tax=Roseateles chitinivorans TaxID=2917965 RepID=UPI003D669D7A